MEIQLNGYWTPLADLEKVRAVVPVENGNFHGVSCNDTARYRARMTSLPGFWRLKERKA